jgi:hypothetical protein
MSSINNGNLDQLNQSATADLDQKIQNEGVVDLTDNEGLLSDHINNSFS